MNNYWYGFAVGVFVTIVVIVLVGIFGCSDAVSGVEYQEVIPGEKVDANSDHPGRPPLPGGWRGEGDLWINDLTGDTLR